jgi:FMN phosphatase YigB (HAD superfamily)
MENQLRASTLDEKWLDKFDGAKVLSLDCFDTILWRKVAQPTDVFYSLHESELFRRNGIKALTRIRGEEEARRRKWVTQGLSEVTLEEIYREIMPDADDDLIAKLIEEEIASEISHGFIFEPALKLIRQAKARRLKVIVLSDTYLTVANLKRLLYALMPELEGLIDQIYTSSTMGKSKTGGVWKPLLAKLNVRPDQVVHLGDNLEADLKAPMRYGINATWLEHQQPQIADLLLQRADVAVQTIPDMRYQRAVPSYFHAQFAACPADFSNPAVQVGYTVLGPILFAFASFVLEEVRALGSSGRKVRTAFLLRDGFMPSRACAALQDGNFGAELNISRFTSIAASLDSKEAVVRVMATTLCKDSIPALTKQFLLPEDMAKSIIDRALKSPQPETEFASLILRVETLKVIHDNSRDYRERLIEHIRRRTGIKPGETLMFVDLGYSGTAQICLKPILKKEMDVDLVGRYLISAKLSEDKDERKGLIDPEWADERLIKMLTSYIAVFEMMCAQDGLSTVDFTAEGDPVFADEATRTRQGPVVSEIQKASLQFINDFRKVASGFRPVMDMRELADIAAIELARLIYFPLPAEIGCLQNFDFDFNLGTDLKLALADPDSALVEMRREGFAYMNKDLSSLRTNYPIELRHIDVSLSTLLLSSHRYGYKITPAKASFRKESIPAIIANGSQHASQVVEAYATHDGYYCLDLPASQNFDMSILLGHSYTHIQFDCLQKVYQNKARTKSEMRIGEEAIFNGISSVEHDLIGLDETGMLYFPAAKSDEATYMRRLVFRPIVRRTAHAG